ncbi:MAG: Immunity protein SdpI [Bacteroidota bacterium]
MVLFYVLLLIGIPFIYAAYLYPSLPEIIPTHFNIKGEADGFGGKGSIYLGPSIMGMASLFTYLFLTYIKKIDPKRSEQMEDGLFQKFGFFTVLFLTALSMVILYATTHQGISIEKLLFPLMGLAFAGMGLYIAKLKQNYFAGFKLPWTLDNVDNWNATHKIAGKVWLYGGIIQFFAGLAFSSVASFVIFFIAMVVMVLVPTIYSYRMFKNGNKVS